MCYDIHWYWKISCMSIPKCHWMVIVVNLLKQTFLLDAAWCNDFMYAGSVLAILTSDCDYRCGMIAIRRCKCSAGISAHLTSRAWWSIPRFWVRLSMLVIAQHNSSKICSMGLHSGDRSGCSIFVILLSWRYQGQLECGEVWRYRLGSSSLPGK